MTRRHQKSRKSGLTAKKLGGQSKKLGKEKKKGRENPIEKKTGVNMYG